MADAFGASAGRGKARGASPLFDGVDDGPRQANVVAVLHETATMRETGVALDRELVQLWTVRGGRGIFLRVFWTKAEALVAAGLSK